MKAILLLALALSSCSLVQPAVDMVEKGAKPMTAFGVIWLAAEFISPVGAAAAGAISTAFWDTAAEEDSKEDAQDLNAAIIMATVGGDLSELEKRLNEEKESGNTMFYLFWGFVLFWVLRHTKDVTKGFMWVLGRIRGPLA